MVDISIGELFWKVGAWHQRKGILRGGDFGYSRGMNFGGRFYRQQQLGRREAQGQRARRIARLLLVLGLILATGLSLWSMLPRTEGYANPSYITKRSFFITGHEGDTSTFPAFAIWEKFSAVSPRPVFGYTRTIDVKIPSAFAETLSTVGNLRIESLSTKATLEDDQPIPIPVTLKDDGTTVEIKVAFSLPSAGSAEPPTYNYGSVWSQLPFIKTEQFAVALLLLSNEKVATDGLKVILNEQLPVAGKRIDAVSVLLNGKIIDCDEASESYSCFRSPGKQTSVELKRLLRPAEIFGIGIHLSELTPLVPPVQTTAQTSP